MKRVRHPVVGDLELGYEGMELTNDRGLLLIAFTAPVGSPSAEGLRLLASWAAPAGLTAQQPGLG